MKVTQDKAVFKPVTIVLETEEEAKAFVQLVDFAGLPSELTQEANDIATLFSNLITNGNIEVSSK